MSAKKAGNFPVVSRYFLDPIPGYESLDSETDKFSVRGMSGYQLFSPILVGLAKQQFIRCLMLRKFCIFVKLIFSVILLSFQLFKKKKKRWPSQSNAAALEKKPRFRSQLSPLSRTILYSVSASFQGFIFQTQSHHNAF